MRENTKPAANLIRSNIQMRSNKTIHYDSNFKLFLSTCDSDTLVLRAIPTCITLSDIYVFAWDVSAR